MFEDLHSALHTDAANAVKKLKQTNLPKPAGTAVGVI